MEVTEPDDPTVATLRAALRWGTVDVPALAERLGLTESHVRLVLSTIADEYGEPAPRPID